MSFNLGNWWKELKCEVCTGSDDDDVDLGLPDGYRDPSWDDPDPFGVGDYSPDPEEPGLFDDFEVPGVPLPGGGEATPDWDDGPAVNLSWPWG